VNIAIFLTFIFTLLKIDKLINWHWILVFSPIIITILIGQLLKLIYLCLTTPQQRRLDEIEDKLRKGN
jgi:hypothetical protein